MAHLLQVEQGRELLRPHAILAAARRIIIEGTTTQANNTINFQLNSILNNIFTLPNDQSAIYKAMTDLTRSAAELRQAIDFFYMLRGFRCDSIIQHLLNLQPQRGQINPSQKTGTTEGRFAPRVDIANNLLYLRACFTQQRPRPVYVQIEPNRLGPVFVRNPTLGEACPLLFVREPNFPDPALVAAGDYGAGVPIFELENGIQVEPIHIYRNGRNELAFYRRENIGQQNENGQATLNEAMEGRFRRLNQLEQNLFNLYNILLSRMWERGAPNPVRPGDLNVIPWLQQQPPLWQYGPVPLEYRRPPFLPLEYRGNYEGQAAGRGNDEGQAADRENDEDQAAGNLSRSESLQSSQSGMSSKSYRDLREREKWLTDKITELNTLEKNGQTLSEQQVALRIQYQQERAEVEVKKAEKRREKEENKNRSNRTESGPSSHHRPSSALFAEVQMDPVANSIIRNQQLQILGKIDPLFHLPVENEKLMVIQNPISSSSFKKWNPFSFSHPFSYSQIENVTKSAKQRKIYTLIEDFPLPKNFTLTEDKSPYSRLFFEVIPGTTHKVTLSGSRRVCVFEEIPENYEFNPDEQGFIAVITQHNNPSLSPNLVRLHAISNSTQVPENTSNFGDRQTLDIRRLRLVQAHEGIFFFSSQQDEDTFFHQQNNENSSNSNLSNFDNKYSSNLSDVGSDTSDHISCLALRDGSQIDKVRQNFLKRFVSSISSGSQETISISIVGCSNGNCQYGSHILRDPLPQSILICIVLVLSKGIFFLFSHIGNRRYARLSLKDSFFENKRIGTFKERKDQRSLSFLQTKNRGNFLFVKFSKIFFIGCKLVIISVVFLFFSSSKAKAMDDLFPFPNEPAGVHAQTNSSRSWGQKKDFFEQGKKIAKVGTQSVTNLLGTIGNIIDHQDELNQREEQKRERLRKEKEKMADQERKKTFRLAQSAAGIGRLGLENAHFHRNSWNNVIARPIGLDYHRSAAYLEMSTKQDSWWSPNLKLLGMSHAAPNLLPPSQFDCETRFFVELLGSLRLPNRKRIQASSQKLLFERQLNERQLNEYILSQKNFQRQLRDKPFSLVAKVRKYGPCLGFRDHSYLTISVATNGFSVALKAHLGAGIALDLYPNLVDSNDIQQETRNYLQQRARSMRQKPWEFYVGVEVEIPIKKL